MTWLIPAVIASLLNAVILFFVYLYLFARDRSNAMKLWAIGWFLYTLRFVFLLLMEFSDGSPVYFAGNQLSTLTSAAFIMGGSYLWLKKKIPLLFPVTVLILVTWILFAILSGKSFFLVTLPPFIFIGMIFIVTGIIIFRYSKNRTSGVTVTSLALVLWGIHKLDYPVLKPIEWFAPWGYLIAASLTMITAVGMVLIYLDDIEISFRESNERFRQLAENIPEVFWVISLTYDELYYISPAYEKVWGKSCKELYQNPADWFESIVEEDREGVAEAVKGLVNNPGQIDFPEYRIRRPDGEERWIQARGFPVYNEKGKMYRVAGIASDITEKKKAFEVYMQSEKLITVGGLAAGIAHEINNPLSIISQGALLVRERLDPGSPKMQELLEQGECSGEFFKQVKEELKVNRYLENILIAVKRVSGIVESMLTYSRPRATGRDFAELNRIIEKALNLVAAEYDFDRNIDFKNIQVEKNLQLHMPLVPCIKEEIEQVVVNILKNASLAFHAMGTREEKNRLSIETAFREDTFFIEIGDNGPGMDESVRQRIFEPFYTTRDEGMGTGLGMFVSYFIITSKHKGTISVDSQPGKGTLFTITLPAS